MRLGGAGLAVSWIRRVLALACAGPVLVTLTHTAMGPLCGPSNCGPPCPAFLAARPIRTIGRFSYRSPMALTWLWAMRPRPPDLKGHGVRAHKHRTSEAHRAAYDGASPSSPLCQPRLCHWRCSYIYAYIYGPASSCLAGFLRMPIWAGSAARAPPVIMCVGQG